MNPAIMFFGTAFLFGGLFLLYLVRID